MLSAPAHPTRRGEGLTVFFADLSGAGKSTTAQVLTWKHPFKAVRRLKILPSTAKDLEQA